MNVVHISSVPEEEQHSPTRKFHSYCRNLSLALGGIRNIGTWAGGHPFDVQIRRIPPGAAVCPLHSHFAQWELFAVRMGAGTIRVGGETHAVKPGDVFVHPPDEPHQLINSGSTDLEVFIFADNPPLDGCYYPDSNKWVLRPAGKIFRMIEVDYFDGEDDEKCGAEAHAEVPAGTASATTPVYRPPPPPKPNSISPFGKRKIHPDDLPWESWGSPKGKFRGTSKELSIALGAKRRTPTGLGGHPFELELGKLAPGERGCPFHSHAAQWELLIFLEGTVTVRAGDESLVLHGGDVVLHPPGESHDFTNTGETDLLYYLVADNPPIDIWRYPDSNKWGINTPRTFFRPVEVDYWDGEE